MCGQAAGKPLKDGRSQGTTVSTSKPEGEREESGPPRLEADKVEW